MGKPRWKRQSRPAARRQRRRFAFYFVPFLLILLIFCAPLAATVTNTVVPMGQGEAPIFSPDLLGISNFMLAATIPGLEIYTPSAQGRTPPAASPPEREEKNELSDAGGEDKGHVEGNLNIEEDGTEAASEQGGENEKGLLDNLSYKVNGEGEKTAGVPEKEPLILIYHTHASESFVPDSGKAFSQNPKETVVAAGERLKEIIEKEYGIGVVHHSQFYDADRNYAYQKARDDLSEIITLFPSIELVLDIHRDGVPRRVTTLESSPSDKAKILLVAGTAHTKWQENYRFAMHLHNSLEEIREGLSRGVRRQNAVYNQHLHPRSLIVELGGYQNTMEEVNAALPDFAEALVKIVK